MLHSFGNTIRKHIKMNLRFHLLKRGKDYELFRDNISLGVISRYNSKRWLVTIAGLSDYNAKLPSLKRGIMALIAINNHVMLDDPEVFDIKCVEFIPSGKGFIVNAYGEQIGRIEETPGTIHPWEIILPKMKSRAFSETKEAAAKLLYGMHLVKHIKPIRVT